MTATDDTSREFADHLGAQLYGYGPRPCIEFEQRWYSGDEIVDYIRATMRALDRGGVSGNERIAVVARNRLPHAAVVLGLLAGRRSVTMLNSQQSPQALARDIDHLCPGAVIADADDWAGPVVAACRRAGCVAVALSLRQPRIATVVDGDRARTRPEPVDETPGLHLLTSGTTGPPKRIAIPMAALDHTVRSMTAGATAAPDDPPELAYWPFGSVGLCQLLAGPYLGKRTVLLERFTVEQWVRAVKTYRITRTGVQPTVVRMLLDADVAPDDLASLQYLPGGSGPLDPQLREEFERRYGIVLLWAYGATEFAGSVCAWTPELHRRFGAAKDGSVGRPLPGVQVRIVDPETRAEMPTGTRGVLTARVEVLGPEWVATTDIASVDADGFVTVHGRADGAINRGGVKVLPETVREVLVGHPAVRDACVVGVPDRRLGQVPFAAVEPRRGMPPASETELRERVRYALPRPHVPVAIVTVPELPRNAALKVRVDEVAAWYDG